MRYQGQLIEWHDDQGYGFIQPLDQKQGEQKIFLHIKTFARRGPRPLAGVMLEYEITQDGKGRLNAQQVSYVRRKQRASGKAATVAPNQHWRSWLIIVYLVFILALQMTQQLPVWAIAIPLVLSGLTYLI